LRDSPLVKHAPPLASRFPEDELHLVYVWWEPDDANEIPETIAHRAEVEELHERLGHASPRLHPLSYSTYMSLVAPVSSLGVAVPVVVGCWRRAAGRPGDGRHGARRGRSRARDAGPGVRPGGGASGSRYWRR